MSNAIRFTDRGEVSIRLASGGIAGGVESVLLTVADTGIGIEAQDLRRLFRPFFQVGSGEQARGGTGLGLAVSQRLVARMGGDIEADSQPGDGTRIRLRLPLAVVPAPGDAQEEEGPRAGGAAPAFAQGLHVLVVDDHPANRLLLQRQLVFLGCRVTLAQDGERALRVWQAGGIDAILTDCAMPAMDGYSLAATVRAIEQQRRAPRCPIIGWTAHVREQERRRALDAGMDECLSKPLGLDDLRQALQRHLQPAPLAEPPEQGLDHVLRTVSNGVPQTQAAFLSTLLQANTRDLDALAGHVRAGAREEVASLAHRIRGAARLVQAWQVEADCEALESAAAAGEPQAMERAFLAVQVSLGELDSLILRRLQAGGSLAH